MNKADKYAPIAGLLQTDSYKLDHKRVYELAGNVTKVYSNWTNRGSRIEGIDKVVHFGLQAFLHKMTETWAPFFEADEDLVVELYRERLAAFMVPGVPLDHIRDLHRLGYLPLRFCAVPEGTRVPLRMPSFTVENTVPEFFWLTNYIETILSATYWQPSTAATLAYEVRAVLDAGAERTGGAAEAVDFQGHDFSFRGMQGVESAAASGAAHLLSFSGTDSLPSLDFIDRYYGGGEYIAASVPATEHSVMCAGSEVLGEEALFGRIIEMYPTGFVSIVSDTFDLWKVLTEFLPKYKDEILARDGRVVIRPDSGNPVEILTGFLDFRDPAQREHAIEKAMDGTLTAEDIGVIDLLTLTFGHTINEAGYAQLNEKIGAIYGDSMTQERIVEVIERLEAKGYASTNFVAGLGSYTYGYKSRDTFMSAIKATWAEVDGIGYALQKDPITDNGTKKSARGRLALTKSDIGEIKLIEEATPEDESNSLLQPVWVDGKFVTTQTFAEVRDVLKGSV